MLIDPFHNYTQLTCIIIRHTYIEYFLFLNFLLSKVTTFQDVVLAEGTGSVNIQPLIDAGTVEVVTTWELSELDAIIICR